MKIVSCQLNVSILYKKNLISTRAHTGNKKVAQYPAVERSFVLVDGC